MTQTPQHFETQVTQTIQLDYLVYLPSDYEDNPDKKYPTILYLHSMGGRGDDVRKVYFSGIPFYLQTGTEMPFIVISPQCPADSHWVLQATALNAFLDNVIEKYRIDEDRISLTGLSMGGSGAWLLASMYPDRFASVAPLCGRIVPLPLWNMTKLPIWAFHGEQDDVIPFSEAQRTIDALEKMDGNVKLTVYPDLGHDIWERTYTNPDLYDWFLKQKRA